MGKLSAYILGLGFALAISFYYLISLFDPILNWLMPVFGTPLIFLITLLYLLMGDPLRNPVLFLILVLLGLLIGVSARKGTRAIGAGILVYGSLWSFAGTSIFSIILNKGSLSGVSNLTSASSLPPVPQGSNLSQIVGEPFVGRIASALETIVSQSAKSGATGTGIPPGINIRGLLFQFLPYIVMDLAIILVVAGLTGYFIHKKFRTRPKSRPTPVENPGTEIDGKVVITSLLIIALLVFSFLMVPIYQNPTGQMESGNHAEPLMIDFPSISKFVANSNSTNFSINNASIGGAIVNKQGDLYNIYGMYSSTGNFGKPWNSGRSNIFTLVFIGDNLTTLLSSLGVPNGIIHNPITGNGTDNYGNIIPDGLVLMAYNGSLNNTSAVATSQILAFSSLGVTNPVKIIGIALSDVSIGGISLSGRYMSLYVYGFTPNVYNSESLMVNSTQPYFENLWVQKALSSGIRNGYLVPGYSPNSMNSSLMITGYVNEPQLLKKVSQSFAIDSYHSGPIMFEGGLFERQNFAHSSSTLHIFNISSLMDLKNSIQIMPGVAFNGIFIGAPERNSTSSYYDFSLYANKNMLKTSSGAQVSFHNISSLDSLNPYDIAVNSNYQFPANISMTYGIREISSGEFMINTTLTNHDSENISNIIINENNIFSPYSKSIRLVSGKPYLQSPAPLGSNKSITFSYVISVVNPGIYTTEPPVLNYTMNGTNYNFNAQPIEIKNKVGSFTGALNQVWYSEFSFFGNQTGFKEIYTEISPGFYVFDLIPLLLILLDIFIEYRAYKRWKNNRQ